MVETRGNALIRMPVPQNERGRREGVRYMLYRWIRRTRPALVDFYNEYTTRRLLATCNVFDLAYLFIGLSHSAHAVAVTR